jgi:hypothetical protein
MGRGERITLPIEHRHICLRDSAAEDLISAQGIGDFSNRTIRSGRAYSWSLECGRLGLLLREYTVGVIYIGEIDNAGVPYPAITKLAWLFKTKVRYLPG